MILYTNSATARHVYQHYIQFGRTSCRDAACMTPKHTGEQFDVSYLIGNGTLVNSEIRFGYTLEPEYPRELGSRTECFYNPQNVIDVVSGKTISYGEQSMNAIKISFHVAAAMLVLILALYVVPWVCKKIKENRNHSNQDAPVRMKVIKSSETKEDMDEKTYVADA
ncbi:unnamed protein product [Adineta ricciae]|uniref:Uncharacterized protein n=1 Tax=Adineta ricciae TaxID=249248 RepID=A0A815ZQY1_ADIRI|nr:unnamed protein product [Adineta ricciae]